MIMLAYINKIAQLEFEQRAQEVEINNQYQEHKTCNDQPANHARNIGYTIQRLRARIAKKS
jgi:hypothetical protein